MPTELRGRPPGRHGPARRCGRPVLATVGVLALLGAGAGAGTAGAASHVHVQPIVNFAIPSPALGCGGAVALGGGAVRIPMTVSTVAGQVAEAVNVCIDGRGPYPFVVDSGAGESIIDAHLAARLDLPHAGPTSAIAGVGCEATSRPVTVPTWSVEGVPLASQTLTAATLPDFGGHGQPVGLLGSDVFSRFGSFRVDFTAGTLTFPGPEGPVPGASRVKALSGPAPPPVLTGGAASATVPVSVDLTPGVVSVNVWVRVGRGTYEFVVDTGSSQSVVASSIARKWHLAHTDQAQRQTTVCSVITTPLVHSGAWAVQGVQLTPQLVDAASFGPVSSDGTEGLLGSDVLKEFGWVVFDYTAGRLVLGAS